MAVQDQRGWPLHALRHGPGPGQIGQYNDVNAPGDQECDQAKAKKQFEGESETS
jgi:hypothetical protein